MTRLKALLAFTLALVFQLGQVQSCGLMSETQSAAAGESSCCCGGCPCIKGSESGQKPAPVLPATQVSKDVAAKIEEPDVAVVSTLTREPVMLQAEAVFRRFAGYPGVGVPVAFCRFLI